MAHHEVCFEAGFEVGAAETLLLFIKLAAAGCANRFEAGAKQHMRHEINSQRFSDLREAEAGAAVVARCGGAVELIESRDGADGSNYRCASEAAKWSIEP